MRTALLPDVRIVIGLLALLAAVFGGFSLLGGHLRALLQPVELLIIGGCALGALLVANPRRILFALGQAVLQLVRPSAWNRAAHEELLRMLYLLLTKVRKEGLISIEKNLDRPLQSPLFAPFPLVHQHPALLEFLTDYLRMMVGGNLNAQELSQLMDVELDVLQDEAEAPSHALLRVADALPAFGIIAAVMGVVLTMESIGLPPSQLGALIAAALVGTFLGVLLSYGIVSPIATSLLHEAACRMKSLQCIKVVLLASMNGYAPQVAVEFGRKALPSHIRPSFLELEHTLHQQRVATRGNSGKEIKESTVVAGS